MSRAPRRSPGALWRPSRSSCLIDLIRGSTVKERAPEKSPLLRSRCLKQIAIVIFYMLILKYICSPPPRFARSRELPLFVQNGVFGYPYEELTTRMRWVLLHFDRIFCGLLHLISCDMLCVTPCHVSNHGMRCLQYIPLARL